jgi:glycosyltransferase involved in cell wall biosynthesis
LEFFVFGSRRRAASFSSSSFVIRHFGFIFSPLAGRSMKIAYIAAGAGGMYCGMCLHDNTLAGALHKRGEEILLVPTYTPLKVDEENMSHVPPIFFGGITVYLKQKLPFLRNAPHWLTWPLDRPWLLKLATKQAGSVDPTKLGDLTVSMLQGELGHQKRELQTLTRWLVEEVRPDVIHLSNAMLLGMVRTFRQEVGCPVISSLSGEDVFLDRLIAPYRQQSQDLIRQRAAEATGFVAMNRYYADHMIDYMGVEADKVAVVPHGLNLAGHGTRRERRPDEPFVIGYMARICHDKGLHLLADAFIQLTKRSDLPPLRLEAAGYMAEADRKYLQEIERKLVKAGVADRFHYAGEIDRTEKIAFLQTLDVMALPTVYRESKGLSVLEAMANAVPVVLPRHGTFPEIIADTQGGLLCEPEDASSLAARLAELALNPTLCQELSRNAKAAITDRYHADLMAERTLGLYRAAVNGQRVVSNLP